MCPKFILVANKFILNMPRYVKRRRSVRRRFKRPIRRRRYSRFARRRARIPRFRSGRSLIPEKIMCKFVYAPDHRFTLTAALGVPQNEGSYTFRANSIGDCDFTGGSAQPYFHDQLASLYGIYYCYKSYIHVHFSNPTATDSTELWCGVQTDDDDTFVGLSNNTARVLPRTRARLQMVPEKVGTTTIKDLSVKNYCIVKKMWPLEALSGLSSSMGNNPTQQCYYHVFAVPAVSGTPDLSNTYMGFWPRITYYCILSNPTDASNS